MNKQPTTECWQCNSFEWKRRPGTWAYCKAKKDWFPADFDLSLNRRQGAETDCKKWEVKKATEKNKACS